MLKFNSANVNILKRLGSALSSLKFNGVKVWPALSSVSTFTFVLTSADPTIDLWLTQSAARAVTVTMDDGTVLTSGQLKAEFPYRFSTGGTHTVTVEVEDGESWYPVVATSDTINFVGKSANNGESDYKLKSVSLGGGLNAYLVGIAAMFAFYRCRGLLHADFSGFDDDAILGFMECTGLENIVFGSNHYNVGASAFQGCTGLPFVSVPANIDKVISFAFAGCTGLKAITLPDSLTTIGEGAFYGCTNLKTVTMAGNVETIDNNAFYKCTELKDLTLSEGLQKIGDAAFFQCDSLEEVVVPEGTLTIGKMAFYYCRSLASLTLPASLTEIGEYALRQAPDEEETNEDGEATFVPLQVITVEGSYAEQYVNENVPKYEPKETSSTETGTESEPAESEPTESEAETDAEET